jgi:hypothetical protein
MVGKPAYNILSRPERGCVVKVKTARYGAGDQWVDVTDIVNTLLQYAGEVTVNNDLAGDPCPGAWKSCVVEHEDGSRGEYQEHETIRFTQIKIANLLYHICPFTEGREQWKWNVDQVKKYANWTNGKRVVSIVQGRGIDNVESVLREFGDFRIDKFIVRVNSDLWEMETFPFAIREIASTSPDEVFFYCHAKGTSKPISSPQLKAARLWTGYMYRFLFGNPEKTLKELNRYSTVGSFKEGDGAFDTNWHFSGTFWGMRHDRLFTRADWDEFHLHRYFIEFYPSRHFKAHDARNLCPIKRPADWLDWPSWQQLAPSIEKALEEFGA